MAKGLRQRDEEYLEQCYAALFETEHDDMVTLPYRAAEGALGAAHHLLSGESRAHHDLYVAWRAIEGIVRLRWPSAMRRYDDIKHPDDLLKWLLAFSKEVAENTTPETREDVFPFDNPRARCPLCGNGTYITAPYYGREPFDRNVGFAIPEGLAQHLHHWGAKGCNTIESLRMSKLSELRSSL